MYLWIGYLRFFCLNTLSAYTRCPFGSNKLVFCLFPLFVSAFFFFFESKPFFFLSQISVNKLLTICGYQMNTRLVVILQALYLGKSLYLGLQISFILFYGISSLTEYVYGAGRAVGECSWLVPFSSWIWMLAFGY